MGLWTHSCPASSDWAGDNKQPVAAEQHQSYQMAVTICKRKLPTYMDLQKLGF